MQKYNYVLTDKEKLLCFINNKNIDNSKFNDIYNKMKDTLIKYNNISMYPIHIMLIVKISSLQPYLTNLITDKINYILSNGHTVLSLLLQNYSAENIIKYCPYIIQGCNNDTINRIYKFVCRKRTYNVSPLSFACIVFKYSVNIVSKLLECPHIDIDYRNKNNSTALIIATQNNDVSTVQLLVNRNADRTITDNTGKTAHNYACSNKLTKILNTHISDIYNPNVKCYKPEIGADFTCKICMDNKINILFYPCKHALCCNNCYKIMDNKSCPICKTDVKYVLDFII